jgi:hypothetical protein
MSTKITLSAVAAAGVVGAALVGLGSGLAGAQPAPPPPPLPAEQGEPVPDWAPPKPAEVWDGQPVVWHSGWGGRWGVWINGGFIPLTSNPVTGGG